MFKQITYFSAIISILLNTGTSLFAADRVPFPEDNTPHATSTFHINVPGNTNLPFTTINPSPNSDLTPIEIATPSRNFPAPSQGLDQNTFEFLREIYDENTRNRAAGLSEKSANHTAYAQFLETLAAVSSATGKAALCAGPAVAQALYLWSEIPTNKVNEIFVVTAQICTAFYCFFTTISHFYSKKSANAKKELDNMISKKTPISVDLHRQNSSRESADFSQQHTSRESHMG